MAVGQDKPKHSTMQTAGKGAPGDRHAVASRRQQAVHGGTGQVARVLAQVDREQKADVAERGSWPGTTRTSEQQGRPESRGECRRSPASSTSTRAAQSAASLRGAVPQAAEAQRAASPRTGKQRKGSARLLQVNLCRPNSKTKAMWQCHIES